MHAYAQTNIQLFNQLRRNGYSGADLNSIRDGYELATQLFTVQFRPSGKTFIAHLVGTASVLVSLKMHATVVLSGLLHAAYQTGDFGTGAAGISVAKREYLIRKIGEEAENYISCYTRLKVNPETASSILDSIETLDELGRRVMFIRLANDLEECLDLSLVYLGDSKRQQKLGLRTFWVTASNKLGCPVLASEFTRELCEIDSTQVPEQLGPCSDRSRSYSVSPGAPPGF